MNLIMYTLRSVAYVIVEPSLMLILILLGVMFYMKNKKVTAMQQMIIGDKVNSALELTLSQIVLGILAGVIASLILSHLGIVFKENSGIELLFMISILLMFIKPRFVCFSYSASILGLVSLIFTYFNIITTDGTEILRIDIMSLIAFVGVLHIVESILVMLDGEKGAIPVFSNKGGRISGGYALNRYWVLPVAIFIAYAATSMGSTAGTESISTPSWWPVLRTNDILNVINTMILGLIPFFGVLGYSSVTFTQKKKKKVLSSGISILIYGIILTIVSQLARFGLIGEVVVLIFAPLAHEGMLMLQKKMEEKREAIFVSDEDGISVLEVVPYSIAYEAGIRVGDKIVSLNDQSIDDVTEIYKMVRSSIYDINVKILDMNGNGKEITLKPQRNNNLGAVLVPKVVQSDKVVAFEDKKFSEVLEKIKEKRKDIK